ncbi:MAG: hypothetical protein JO212_20255 [Acetobacteraceae bacterium]|nr:hypothetical protein [Acetobacteraceae bacterium]MBV8592358.1 hypothetical protein [Acetobacteraceae bacterium]
MEPSYAADDFRTIARRMREISDERRKAEENQRSPVKNPAMDLNGLRRIPSQVNDLRIRPR